MTEHRNTDELTDAERAAEQEAARRGGPAERAMRVRESDLEPYVGLGYLSKLFRFIAVFLAILLVAEVATGLVAQGRSAVPTLLAEASRLIVLAGLLWGAGDLAILLIDVGHDVRAARILLGRQVAHTLMEDREDPFDQERPLGSAARADRLPRRLEPVDASRTGPTGL
ncbi:MAG TPA: hypothetical protein VF048_01760 [Gemmatimonadaceae bacterium]|jgi:hypothetical protein